ncbi:hypothetical protein I350_07291 [Cryptococcus amylolentus CBS 6273]|uniref:C2H2-type domain-containing protein n=1 Tax=Cryptococcus amylolentus CBS 6273 TaxID=1296118 RepID=A0A1E3JEN6_9TREE|nr:hypothetical protein I350_07291 [Cryptococcus amylolentus CBS 6273]
MVSTRSPPPPSSTTPTKLLRSPRSPRSPKSPFPKPADSFAPLTSVLADKAQLDAAHPIEPKALLLQRVLSGGSTATTATSESGTASPSMKSVPLSPSSPGTRTPRAGQQQLAGDMDGLNVRSPISNNGQLPGEGMLGMVNAVSETPEEMAVEPASQESNGNDGSNGKEIGVGRNGHGVSRSYSSSTESSSSQHPVPPSYLGSSYGPEGFPISQSPMDSPMAYPSYLTSGLGYFGNGNDPELAAKQAAALARADEAVRQLNNTSTVIQGPTPGLPYPTDNFAIPRNYTNFVTPQQAGPPVTRQSSTSSSTDAASTSSEESDWCIPSIEWVPANQWQQSNYLNSPGSQFARDKERTASSSRMPPPSSIKPSSPRRPSADRSIQHRNSIPVGASAGTPPPGMISRPSWSASTAASSEPPEDDDDAATVGHAARERSHSTSSQSAQSGLDLLWRAAHGLPHASHVGTPYDPAFEHKGKRKAGAEAVDKWRASGIPTGVPPGGDAEVEGSTPPLPGPPRKRRRSEMELEPMDEDLEEVDEDEPIKEELSDYHSPSTSEPVPSDHDSDYGGSSAAPKRGKATGRGRGRPKGSTAAVGGPRGRTLASKVDLATAPGGVTKQGNIKKVRKVGDSPNGLAKGASKEAVHVPPGGVQCDYINPLPPYNRCTDVFTRKYDLPRHMARHARREGELVVEGALDNEKAVLWKKFKDKPKVQCDTCGESFTRMDALKRHQAKQHH